MMYDQIHQHIAVWGLPSRAINAGGLSPHQIWKLAVGVDVFAVKTHEVGLVLLGLVGRIFMEWLRNPWHTITSIFSHILPPNLQYTQLLAVLKGTRCRTACLIKFINLQFGDYPQRAMNVGSFSSYHIWELFVGVSVVFLQPEHVKWDWSCGGCWKEFCAVAQKPLPHNHFGSFSHTLGKLQVHRFLEDWITPTLQATKNINLKHKSITFCKMCLEGSPPFLICPLFSSATNMKGLVDMHPWTHTFGTQCLISTIKCREFNKTWTQR